MNDSGMEKSPRLDAVARLGVGVLQGLAIYAVFFKARGVLAAPLYGALSVAAVLAPFAVLGAIGAMGRRTAIPWLVTATVFLAGFGAYDAFVDHGDPVVNVAPQTWFGLGAALFIAHRLVVSADADRRWFASYGRHFDEGWRDGVRIVLAAAFVGAFWLLLLLGAALFSLIGLSFLTKLIVRPWFAWPATTTFFALAVHLTDVRADLVRGARTLALALLSWLLPLMTLIGAAFLGALPFTGLTPLWAVGSATGLMLAAAAVLVVLVNAAYQSGEQPDFPPKALKWSARAAALILPIFGAVAAYGLLRRIDQHGLTPDRIYALACILVGAVYAVGYAWAAAARGPWMKRVEPVNIAAAHLILALALLLVSPLLDPARLSVDDQVRRLDQSEVSPKAFDYKFLKFDSGRWGRAALKRLAARRDGPQAVEIAQAAEAALALNDRYDVPRPSRAVRLQAIQPAGGPLPPSFVGQSWKAGQDPFEACAAVTGGCVALTADIDGDGQPEVMLFGQIDRKVYQLQDGSWSFAGQLWGTDCGDDVGALKAGRFKVPAPEPPALVEVDGQRLAFLGQGSCPPHPTIMLQAAPSQTNRAANSAASR